MDDRTLRIAVVVIGHLMWLSTAALRLLRGERAVWLRGAAGPAVESYPVLVWIPLVAATLLVRVEIEIADGLRLAGVGIALAGSLFAAWAMWSLGRAYGIRTDLYVGHALETDGPYALVRHPMYLGILVYHVGAAIAMESALLLASTAAAVLPYTALRIAAEERVLRAGFGGAHEHYAGRVPTLLPLPRPR